MPSRAKGITGRDLKFAGYIPHYKILTDNIFGLVLKHQMAAMGVSLSVMKKCLYLPYYWPCEANLWKIMGLGSSEVVRFDLGSLLQG